MRGTLHLSLLTLMLCTGCADSSRDVVQDWAARMGGVVDAETSRAESALDRLKRDTGVDRTYTVKVLQNEQPSAFAWPGGNLYVTTGLLRQMSDDELLACLAHEAGHLNPPGVFDANAALSGRHTGGSGEDEETRADDVAVDLLRRSSVSVKSLRTALEKVRNDPNTPPACRSSIDRRMCRLDMVQD